MAASQWAARRFTSPRRLPTRHLRRCLRLRPHLKAPRSSSSSKGRMAISLGLVSSSILPHARGSVTNTPYIERYRRELLTASLLIARCGSNMHGRVEHSTDRFALHRFFVHRHALCIRVLSPLAKHGIFLRQVTSWWIICRGDCTGAHVSITSNLLFFSALSFGWSYMCGTLLGMLYQTNNDLKWKGNLRPERTTTYSGKGAS